MPTTQRKIVQHDLFDDHAAGKTVEAEIINMPLPPPEPTLADHQARPAMRVGEILKRERERRGYDIGQIAEHLCIRRGLLLAIENSRYEEFPADAYVIGFLRSYADLIGLDGQEAINYYRQEMAGRRKKPDLILPTPISEGRAPTAVIMGAAAFASLVIYIMWYAFSTNDRTTVSAPPPLPMAVETAVAPAAPPAPVEADATPPAVSSDLPSTVIDPNTSTASSGIAIAGPAPSQKPMAPETPTTPAATATKPAAIPTAAAPLSLVPTTPAKIVIKADQSSWVMIADEKGKTIYDHVMKPGETYQVPSTPGLKLTTGNGAGITVSIDGKNIPRLSTIPSHMLRNVPLEPASLKAPQP